MDGQGQLVGLFGVLGLAHLLVNASFQVIGADAMHGIVIEGGRFFPVLKGGLEVIAAIVTARQLEMGTGTRGRRPLPRQRFKHGPSFHLPAVADQDGTKFEDVARVFGEVPHQFALDRLLLLRRLRGDNAQLP